MCGCFVHKTSLSDQCDILSYDKISLPCTANAIVSSVSTIIRLRANQGGLEDSLPAGEKIVQFLQFPALRSSSHLPTESVRWPFRLEIKWLCLVIQHGVPSGARLRLHTPLRLHGAIL